MQFEKPSRRCIFCENDASSRGEHLFSAWMKPFIKHNPLNHKFGVYNVDPRSPRTLQTKSGALHSRTIPHVCQKCNNGWMSQIDERGKDVLTLIMRHQPVALTAEIQRTLAEWATLKAFVGEYLDPPTATAWLSTRTEFCRSRRMPSNYKVWIGTAAASCTTEYYHHTAKTYARLLITAPNLPANSQISSFLFSGVVVHTRWSY